MTINLATTNANSALSILGASGAANASASSGSASELTDEEKKYDIDGDGTLSITEKAAYREAKSKERALESLSKSIASGQADTVHISAEALKLQKEGGSGDRLDK
jgi:hypothetical protein